MREKAVPRFAREAEPRKTHDLDAVNRQSTNRRVVGLCEKDDSDGKMEWCAKRKRRIADVPMTCSSCSSTETWNGAAELSPRIFSC